MSADSEKMRSEWTRTDPRRWGDSQAVTLAPAGTLIAPAAVTAQSTQLAMAFVPRPVVWLVQLDVDGEQIPTGETAPIDVDFALTYGCGQASTTVHYHLGLLAANGYHWPPGPPPEFWLLPAANLQIVATVGYLSTVAGVSVVRCSAMIAPFTRWD